MFSRTQLLPGAVNNAFNSFHQYVADWLVFTCVLPPIFYPLTPRVPRFQKHPLLDKMSCESGFPRFFHQGLRNFATGPTGYQSGKPRSLHSQESRQPSDHGPGTSSSIPPGNDAAIFFQGSKGTVLDMGFGMNWNDSMTSNCKLQDLLSIHIP